MSRRVAPKTTLTLSEDEQTLRKTESGKLIFTAYRGYVCGMLLQNDRLVHVSVLQGQDYQPSEKSTAVKNDKNGSAKAVPAVSKVGAIYIGKIRDVVKNINAYFVEIERGELCFLSFAKAQNAVVLNRTNDGRLLAGDEIMVQVERDAQKTKQASVTTYISLPNADELDMLKQKAVHRTCFSCLKEAPSPLESVLNQFSVQEYREIVTDIETIYKELQAIYLAAENLTDKKSTGNSIDNPTCCNLAEHLTENLIDNNLTNQFKPTTPVLRLYQDNMLSLAAVYGLNSKMDTALERRIWLKSGGYLYIEPTEAMTVIDVNTGKYEAKKDAEEAFYKINMEAAEEIAIQLRLRNLSGIIIVDFINMHSRQNRMQLMEHLKTLAAKDKTTTVIVDMTPLGLVEITRKKINKPLAEYFK